MALPGGTLATYETIGIREDLSDVIYRIDPTEVPFLSAAKQETATAINHEWQIQTLAAAAANTQLEGGDASATAVTARTRRGNILQISGKWPRVTGSDQAVNVAGTGNEFENQELLKGLELKRDMELACVGLNVAKNAGADATARVTASVQSWIKTNTSKGVGGSDPAAADGTGTRTDGTQRAFTEVLLKTVLAGQYTSGGKAGKSTIFVGAFNKQAFSTFTGRATPMENTSTKKIVASVTAYDSDFGLLDIVPDLFMRSRDSLVLQMDLWAVAYLKGRKFVSSPLAKTGDSDWKQLLSEFCVMSRQEAGSAIVADLTTS